MLFFDSETELDCNSQVDSDSQFDIQNGVDTGEEGRKGQAMKRLPKRSFRLNE